MGIFDKAKDALGDNPDQVEGGIDNVADFADDRAGAASTGEIDSGADVARDKVGDYLGSPDEAQSMPDPTGSGSPPAGSPEPPD
jgi:MT0933-like antitoxin protein